MIHWIDAWVAPGLWLLGAWSLRWAVLILAATVWFLARPPKTAAVRLLVSRCVLGAGLLLPFIPPCWGPHALRADATPPTRQAVANARGLREGPGGTVGVTPSIGSTVPLKFAARTGTPTVARSREAFAVGELLPVEPDEPLGIARWLELFLAVVWLLGVSLGTARLVLGWFWLRRLCRSALPPSREYSFEFERCRQELRVGRPVQLGAHAAVYAPFLVGGRRPWILVPSRWPVPSAEARRAILLHELAHLRRRDDFAKTAEESVRAFFFFHPLVHWLLAEIASDREELCDAEVVNRGFGPRELAGVLLECCRYVSPGRSLLGLGVLGMSVLPFFRPRTLKNRIASLMEDRAMTHWTLHPSRRSVAAVVTATIAVLVTIGGFAIRAAEPEPAVEPLVRSQKPAAVPQTALPTPKEIQAGYRENFSRLMPLGIRFSVTEADGMGNIEYDRSQQRLYQELLDLKPGEIAIDGQPPDEGKLLRAELEAKILAEMTRAAPSHLQQLDEQLTPEQVSLRLKPHLQGRFFWTDGDSFHLREPRDDRGKMFAGRVSPPANLVQLYPNVRLASRCKGNQPPLRVWWGLVGAEGQGCVGTCLTDFWAGGSFPAVGFVKKDWIAYGWHDFDLFMSQDPSRYRVVGPAELNGKPVILVEGFFQEKGPRTRAWIDPKQGFLPLRLEEAYLDSAGKEKFVGSVTEVFAVAKVRGAYYPTRSKRQEFVNSEVVNAPGPRLGAHSAPLFGRSKTWEVAELLPQQAIEPAVLALSFPKGTLYMRGSDRKWFHAGNPAPEPERPEPIKPGQMAPPLKLVGWTDGRSRNLSDFRGRVVVLDFWQMTGSGSASMIAAMNSVKTRLNEKGLVFLEIHAAGARIDKVREFQNNKKWDALVGLDVGPDLAFGATWREYGLHTGSGGVIVIGRDGRVDFNCDALDEVSGDNMLWRAAKALSIPWNAKPTEAESQQMIAHWLGEAIERALARR